MVQQLARPKDTVEVYWFSEQPYGHVTDEDLEKYDSGRLGFPNSHFDPLKAHVLYNQYHEEYAQADEVGFDGIMSNEQLQQVNNIIVGNPDTVTRKLTEVIERLSPGYLHIYGNEGAMDYKGVTRSIELLGKEVIPALHEVKLQPYE